jgi:hypothetical protein
LVLKCQNALFDNLTSKELLFCGGKDKRIEVKKRLMGKVFKSFTLFLFVKRQHKLKTRPTITTRNVDMTLVQIHNFLSNCQAQARTAFFR